MVFVAEFQSLLVTLHYSIISGVLDCKGFILYSLFRAWPVLVIYMPHPLHDRLSALSVIN
jgi:hypothetical protein